MLYRRYSANSSGGGSSGSSASSSESGGVRFLDIKSTRGLVCRPAIFDLMGLHQG